MEDGDDFCEDDAMCSKLLKLLMTLSLLCSCLPTHRVEGSLHVLSRDLCWIPFTHATPARLVCWDLISFSLASKPSSGIAASRVSARDPHDSSHSLLRAFPVWYFP